MLLMSYSNELILVKDCFERRLESSVALVDPWPRYV